MELAAKSGCFICHTIDSDPAVPVPLGPPYRAIAARYRGEKFAFYYLLDRVKYGTQGKDQAWPGQVNMRFMPPNVNVADAEARRLVEWILSLDPGDRASTHLATHESMVALATNSGCMICHGLEPDERVPVPLAPAFREIGARYGKQPGSVQRLDRAIRDGTVDQPRAWGDRVNMRFMPPNVNVSDSDSRKLADWILSLEPGTETTSTPKAPAKATSAGPPG